MHTQGYYKVELLTKDMNIYYKFSEENWIKTKVCSSSLVCMMQLSLDYYLRDGQ